MCTLTADDIALLSRLPTPEYSAPRAACAVQVWSTFIMRGRSLSKCQLSVTCSNNFFHWRMDLCLPGVRHLILVDAYNWYCGSNLPSKSFANTHTFFWISTWCFSCCYPFPVLWVVYIWSTPHSSPVCHSCFLLLLTWLGGHHTKKEGGTSHKFDLTRQ